MQVVRSELTSSALYSNRLRYYGGYPGGEVQYFNGTSWIPAPSQNPQLVSQVPPPDTADPACDGAARITAHYQALVAAFIEGAAGGATTVITAFLLLLFPAFALLWVIISVVVNGLLSIGSEDVADAFLGDEWDVFRCIVYANIGADGFVTEAGFSAIRSAVDSDIGGTAASVLNLLMDMTGPGGMNDAAGQRTETGDCFDCTPGWCYIFDFSDGSAHGWDVVLGSVGADQIVGGYGQQWRADGVAGTAYSTTVRLQYTLAVAATITSARFNWYNNYNGSSGDQATYRITWAGADVIEANNQAEGDVLSTVDLSASTPDSTGVIDVAVAAGFSGAGYDPEPTCNLCFLILRGTGDNPFGADNC